VVAPDQAKQPFNIAHTDGLVLCGVADQEAELVGVDVEATNRRTSTELAERYFSEPEIAFLRSQPEEQQKYFFLRIWTLKEAFIKAIGTGLQTPLADFAFDQIDSPTPTIEFLKPDLDDGRNWNFVCYQPRKGFIASAAVAAKGKKSSLGVDWNTFEDLLEGA
jgi:4'-phosphopantetheinyl transferase